jgi:flagellar basal body-associated protein FliL
MMPDRDEGDMDQFSESEPDDTEAHAVAPDPDPFSEGEPDDTEAQDVALDPDPFSEGEPEDTEEQDVAPDPDQFSGSELDDTEEQDVAPDPAVEEIYVDTNKRKNHRRLFFLGMGACVCTILASLCWFLFASYRGTDEKQSNRPQGNGVVRMSINTDQTVYYNSFIIPTEKHETFTYISFSISFKLLNHNVKREMVKRRYQLRGIIYDTLQKRIDAEKTVPTIEQLKQEVAKIVNSALSAGSIDDAYVTDFLAV